MRARCWPRRCACRWMSGCGSGSWPRREVIRSRCWSCRGGRRSAQLAGGFGLARTRRGSSGRIEGSFRRRRLAGLPAETQQAVAGRGGRAGSADPVAADGARPGRLRGSGSRRRPYTADGLAHDRRAASRFVIPLVRSAAIIQPLSPEDRQTGASRPGRRDRSLRSIPHRRAWRSCPGDAGVRRGRRRRARALRRAALRRGQEGFAAAAERPWSSAFALTPEPSGRARRARSPPRGAIRRRGRCPRRRARHSAATARGATARPSSARPSGPPPRPDRVRRQPRPRRARRCCLTAAELALEPLDAAARARDLPRRVVAAALMFAGRPGPGRSDCWRSPRRRAAAPRSPGATAKRASDLLLDGLAVADHRGRTPAGDADAQAGC